MTVKQRAKRRPVPVPAPAVPDLHTANADKFFEQEVPV
jgi:hypothetical protein